MLSKKRKSIYITIKSTLYEFHTVPSIQFNGEKAAAYNRDFFSLIGP